MALDESILEGDPGHPAHHMDLAKEVNLLFERDEDVKAANYTLVLTDAQKIITMDVAGANTLTVPPNSSVAFPVGTIVELFEAGAGQTTVTAGVGVTLRAPNGTKLANPYSLARLWKRDTDEWVLSGDTAF